MIHDFIDPELYQKLNQSIFNLDKLQKQANRSPEYR